MISVSIATFLTSAVVSNSKCEFQTFSLGTKWKCIPGGDFPEYQYPGLCDPSNDMVPDTFEIVNRSDGLQWAYELKPSRSTVSKNSRKETMYLFNLDTFKCSSLTDYEASIIITPFNEKTPEQWWLEFFVTMTLVLVCILSCVCWDSYTSQHSTFDSAFWGAWVGSNRHEERKVHFE